MLFIIDGEKKMPLILQKKIDNHVLYIEIKNFIFDHVDTITIDIHYSLPLSRLDKEKISLKYFPFLNDILILNQSNSLTGEPLFNNIDNRWYDLLNILNNHNDNQILEMQEFANKLRIPYDELNNIINSIEDNNFDQKQWNEYVTNALKIQWFEELKIFNKHINDYQEYNNKGKKI